MFGHMVLFCGKCLNLAKFRIQVNMKFENNSEIVCESQSKNCKFFVFCVFCFCFFCFLRHDESRSDGVCIDGRSVAASRNVSGNGVLANARLLVRTFEI